MKAVNGRTVAINTTRKDIEGAVRLTKGTNMMQLVSGNNVIIHVAPDMKEHVIWKALLNLTINGAESIRFTGEDWNMDLLAVTKGGIIG